jgi:hypothetical protein
VIHDALHGYRAISRSRSRTDLPPVPDQGRMMPEGLYYRGSWIEKSFDRCFQFMECDDERLFQDWIKNWSDLVDFEIVSVATSDEMRKMMFPSV